jgi:cytidyltransferase-like protein
MILSPADSSEVAGRVVLVDGSFDPLHDGHIEYFRRASEFGLPVLCNIAPDSWTSQKHPIFLEQHKRAVIIDAIRFVSYVMVGGNSTAEILEAVRPKAYVKGSDWKVRGGIPANEQAICDRLQIEVFYLDTVLNSSSTLLHRIRAGNEK